MILARGILALCLMLPATSALAAEVAVPAQGDALARAIAAAEPGTVLRLRRGTHGPVVVDKPLTLQGEPGAVVDGGGAGTVIRVTAENVAIRNLEVRNSGVELHLMDSAILLDRAAHGALIENNRLINNSVGVYVWGPRDAVVRGNVIHGRDDLRLSERGDSITIWNAPGTLVEGNEVVGGRDGILVRTSKQNRFIGNTFRGTRMAIHFMYASDSELTRNVAVDNHVGYALMFSTGLEVRENLALGDRDHGFALNYATDSRYIGNVVRDGGEKCVFIYNSARNEFRDNIFAGCDIGIHFTAGSERNAMSGNAFLHNRNQVKYVGTRHLDWSVDGRGNYWSDNPAFDLDGDGIADVAYRPNDIVDRIVWAVPLAQLLLNSPAVQMVRWAQAQFPAITPGGVVDSAPLMRPPPSELFDTARRSDDRG